LVIPTPGQAEQEYLGELHARTGRFLVRQQATLDLPEALETLGPTPVLRERSEHSMLDDALDDLAGLLR
jgi:hypothetical protein